MATGTRRGRASAETAPETAPETTPETTDAPETVAPLSALALSESVRKSERVFADVAEVPRVALEDGRTCAVQRETRADGTSGPLMLAFVRKGTDGRESATRVPLRDIALAQSAYFGAGIPLIGTPTGADPDAAE